jgi:hypothetical protein
VKLGVFMLWTEMRGPMGSTGAVLPWQPDPPLSAVKPTSRKGSNVANQLDVMVESDLRLATSDHPLAAAGPSAPQLDPEGSGAPSSPPSGRASVAPPPSAAPASGVTVVARPSRASSPPSSRRTKASKSKSKNPRRRSQPAAAARV